MQPVVRDEANQFDRQTHAYAEFRLFTRLAGERGAVASAVMTLRRSEPTGVRDAQTVCWITVVVSDGKTLHVTATGHHPYAAIDRAVADIAEALQSHDLRRRSARETA